MARLSRNESKERTKQKLLESAKKEFAKAGFSGSSADLIANRAGYSKGAFYAHFATKEEIFLELLTRHFENEAKVMALLFANSNSVDDILNGIQQWFVQMQQDANWALLSVELILQAKREPQFGRKFDEILVQHKKKLALLVKRFFKNAHKRPPVNPEKIAAALMGLAHGFSLIKTVKDEKQNTAGEMTVLFLKGLLLIGA